MSVPPGGWVPPPAASPIPVSYSQNAEDIRLARVFTAERGFYVDVGAGDPTAGSLTKLFYDRGWSGINVEPGPMFERLLVERPRDVNLNVAVAATAGRHDLWISRPHWGLTTTVEPDPAAPLPF